MGDLVYRPIIEGMVWSYSRISCFYDCRYRWFMKYIYEADSDEPISPKFYASYGKFIHKLIEGYYRGEIRKDDLKEMFIRGFSNEVQGIRPPESILQSYIKKGIKYFDEFDEFPFETVAVEELINFDIDGIPFVAVVDYIGKDTDGCYVIVDNKSRDLKPRSNRKRPTRKDEELDEMLRQLYVYSAAIKHKYGEFPKKLCFNCFKEGSFIEEDFDENKYREAIKWVKDSIEEIKEATIEDFFPSIEFFGCYYICDMSDSCCYWAT